MKRSFKGLPWLSPQDEAEIALKALNNGDFKKIAKEYNTDVEVVFRLRNILEENAVDIFLQDIEGKCLHKLINQIRGQISIFEGIVNELGEVIGMKCGSYFAD